MAVGRLQRNLSFFEAHWAALRSARWVAGALILWLAWGVAKPWLFDTEHYQKLLESHLSEATGLDTSIGRMKFVVLPFPKFHAADVTLTGEELTVAVGRVDFAVEVRALPTRRLEVLDLRAREVDVRVPPDARALEQSLQTILENVRAFAARPRPIRGQFHRIQADDIRVAHRGGSHAIATGSVSVEGLQSSQPRFSAKIRAPEFGLKARLVTQGKFTSGDNGWISLSGTGRGAGFDPSKALMGASIDGEAAGNLAFSYSDAGLRMEIDGALDAKPAALAGPLRGTIWWRNGMVVVNDFQLQAPGLIVALEATRYADGRWALQIPEAEAGAHALSALLGEDAPANPQTTATASNWLLARDTSGWRTVAGTGLLREWPPAPASAPELALAADYALSEHGIQIGGQDEHGLEWAATIAPADRHWHTLHIAGAGRAPATHPWIRERMPRDVVVTTGDVTVTAFRGTYTRGIQQILQWHVAGMLDGVGVDVQAGEKPLELRAIRGDFHGTSSKTNIDLRGTSADIGIWTAAGDWEAPARTWAGNVTLDVPRVAMQWDAVREQEERLAPVLEAFGKSALDVEAVIPESTEELMEISVTRTGVPAATLDAGWRRSEQEISLEQLAIVLNLPAETLTGFAPKDARLDGEAQIALSRHAVTKHFQISGNLDEAMIGTGWWLDKPRGAPLTLQAKIGPGDEISELTIAFNDEQLMFQRTDERLVSRNVTINLAALAPYTPLADTLGGTARGSLALQPFKGNIVLANAAATNAGGPAIDSVSGAVAWSEGTVTLTDLAVSAANSELLITARCENNLWSGAITGSQLDATAGAEWYEQAAALVDTSDGPGPAVAAYRYTGDDATAAKPRQPFLGSIDIDLDKVKYRRGEFEFFEAKLTGKDHELRLDEIQFRPNTGNITGKAAVRYTDKGRVIRAELQADTIDARILDEVLFDEPRGIFGVVNAALDLEAPWGDTRTMRNGLDGTVHWRAKDGSWGRMGFATKLLTALNATDIFRLKKPDFTDRGLIYNTCSGMLIFTEGVMQLRDVEMRAPAYTLTAVGTVDYPLDAADVAIRVAPLAGINRRFADVPLLRDIAKHADRLTDVQLRMTGSPFDPSIGLASGF